MTLHDLDARVEWNRGRADPLASETHPPRPLNRWNTVGFQLASRCGMSLAQEASMRIEQERPSEWLRALEEEPDAYLVLVTETGGLARAAYRLASARCRARSGWGETPTLRELQLAALHVAQRVGVVETLPITSLLSNDCEEQGLPVMQPMPTPPSSRRTSVPPLRRAS